ncbi:MAG: RNA 3'-terminal phosphate cyclase [Nanoarchaeota archaeon]|nr:RNA 3'-terminal phosphate cyclase [Nanoarchaeota archaeon]MBU1030158.1 RNA 3'-terminal phosphate cyclase [Nanoarchaeota archaeon]MBU1849399.1 RNA 3'-terminal phosphate cyclase [Nanoarchaeota archaeon]
MIQLDGSLGEGGGAILRQALALSTLTKKPFEIKNIRKGRPTPGLKAQHMHSIIALEKISGCNTVGCELGSDTITFIPGDIKNKHIKVDVGTAGSITLLLQSLILPIIFSGKKVIIELTGGTDVKWSQPIDHFTNVFVPHLKKYAEIEVNTMNRGYYPKGGGKIILKIKSNTEQLEDLKEIQLTKRGELLQIRGISHASADLESAMVAYKQLKNADVHLAHLKVPINIRMEYSKTPSTGAGICIWGLFGIDGEYDFIRPVIIGVDSLGEREKKSEAVGKEAAEKFLKEYETNTVVDKYTADQLIPVLAVTGGQMLVSKITNHLHSNIYVCEKFLPVKFEISENLVTAKKLS